MNAFSRILAGAGFLLAGAWMPSAAMDVAVEGGGLRKALEGATDVDVLKITGSVDIRDFDFMVDALRNLRELDLSEARIAPYQGEATFLGRTSAPADELPECALMGTPVEKLILPATLRAVGTGALGGSALRSVVIPDGVESIGTGAFSGCRSLQEVSIPAGVATLGEGAFRDCVALSRVVVGAPLRSIGASTFSGCVQLAEVQLPESLKIIGDDAFGGCTSLRQIAFPAGLQQIGARAFAGTGVTAVDLGECASLAAVGNWAFAGCDSLAEVTLPSALEVIGRGAFHNDASIRPGALPATLREVGDFALKGWSQVQLLELPSTLEYIGTEAMANWTALERISAEELMEVPALGADVWRGVEQGSVKLVVADDMTDAFRGADQWADFNVLAVSGIDDVTTLAPGENRSVGARFEGMTLILESPSVEIAGVQLYDPAGRICNTVPAATADRTRMSVDTSILDTPVMIVRVRLADGSAAVLKLTR